jgi:hypothetical protein
MLATIEDIRAVCAELKQFDAKQTDFAVRLLHSIEPEAQRDSQAFAHRGGAGVSKLRPAQ